MIWLQVGLPLHFLLQHLALDTKHVYNCSPIGVIGIVSTEVQIYSYMVEVKVGGESMMLEELEECFDIGWDSQFPNPGEVYVVEEPIRAVCREETFHIAMQWEATFQCLG